MSDATIARDFSDIPPELREVALLAETFAMAREVELSKRALQDRQEQVLGTFEDAQSVIKDSLFSSISSISEYDLEKGLNSGILSPEDHAEVVRLKRTLELGMSRGDAQEQDRER